MLRTLASVAALLVFTAGCSSTQYGRDGRYPTSRYPSSRSYPSSAKTGSGSSERYVLCHRGQTKTLPTAAVDGHLRHGDSFGRCGNRRSSETQDRDQRRRDDRRGDRREADRDDDQGRGNGNGNGNRGRGNGRGNGNGNGNGRGNHTP